MRGLTLIELLVVLVIIGILAAIAVPGYRGIQKRSAIRSGEASVNSIKLAVEQYRTFQRTYLNTSSGCGSPVVQDSSNQQIDNCYRGANIGSNVNPWTFRVEASDTDYRICAIGVSGSIVNGLTICVDERNNWGDESTVTFP
jgi:prepilin-type N-terminal cleavage/methylation domain-containing protein